MNLPNIRKNLQTFLGFLTLALLFLGLAASVILVTERQEIRKEAAQKCQKIPAGNYNVWIKTYKPTSWEVVCGTRKWSGELPPTKIPFGYLWVPKILEGRKYSVQTTLKDICSPSPVKPLGAEWQNICQVCQFIDCSKVTIKGEGIVEKIDCQLGAYQAEGEGEIKLAYQGDLGCTAKATYSGKLMGSFIIGPAPSPPPKFCTYNVCDGTKCVGVIGPEIEPDCPKNECSTDTDCGAPTPPPRPSPSPSLSPIPTATPACWLTGDFNCDGEVDLLDFEIFRDIYVEHL